MSRIREALTKIEGGARPVTPVAAATHYATARELERRRYERAAYAEPKVVPAKVAEPVYREPAIVPEEPRPEYEATPAPAPFAAYDSPIETLPGLPADFHAELAGLRFTIESALPGRVTRVVQFAAAVGGEGTTTVAANFARVLAEDPTQNVLLVDANVRRPGVALFFGLNEGPGLRELTDAGVTTDAERYVQAVERPNLHVLTATTARSALAHVFQPESVRAFWARFGRRYQWVIVDAAPVIEAPETATLGATVDTTVIVIQAARTKRGIVQRAMERCAKASVPVLGAVLNRRRLDIPEFIYRRI